MESSSKYIWQINADTNGRGDFDFFITANEKYGIYYSNIDEYGMMKFVSPVQVWTGNKNPRLLYQSRQIKFEYQHSESCYYLQESDILVLMTPCHHQKYFDLPYVLFDFSKNVFTTINAPNFRLTEIGNDLVQLDLHFRYSYDEEVKIQISQDNGKEIDLTKLKWHNLKEIDNACKLMTKNNR